MQLLSKTKIGPFLVISSVLALWTFLVAQHVQAHPRTVTLPTPSCGGLPGDDFFGDSQTHDITSASADLVVTTLQTTRGGGTTGTGNNRYHYAKVTIPTLAAGELRVFDGTTTGALSNAVLCRGSSQVARSITTYGAHNTAHAAAAAADDNDSETTTDDFSKASNAATAATTAATDIPQAQDAQGTLLPLSTRLSRARTALGTARSALSTARSDLATAARALYAASTALGDTTTANTPGNTAEVAARAAALAEQRALEAHNESTPPSRTGDQAELDSVIALLNVTQLSTDSVAGVAGALSAAASALNATAGASFALTTAANNMHTGFKIRASVMPGDEEYTVVVAPLNTGSPPRAGAAAITLNVAFHGAIATTATEQRTRVLNNDAVDSIPLMITAPGLLTLEATGSVDTIGILADAGTDLADTADDVEVAYAESGGSGDNFKIVVPVTLTTAGAAKAYSVMVEEGQTSGGEYTLDMDFKVAMVASSGLTNVPVTPAATPWATGNQVAADDTILQIKRIAADGNTADEDYVLFTPTASGLLTVNANDDTDGSTKDAATSGTLYGAMETGPLGEMRTGEIATDTDSGPGSHFKFAVPVAAGKNYLVKVEGTDGYYTLMFAFNQTAADIAPTSSFTPTTGDPPTPKLDPTCPPSETGHGRGEICRSTGEPDTERYLINIAGSGALYLHTTGGTDVVGTLYGADGQQIAMDDNSGTGTNFRIATNVGPGLYLLEVRGQTKAVQGVYGLVSNFVTGAEVETPTTPTTPPPPPPPPPPATDATGALDNPPPDSTRSGVGIISGWVCQAETLTVTITPVRDDGTTLAPFNIGYGADRPDTVGQCDHGGPNTGFGMAFNFNRLAEGEYQISVSADGERIGTTAHLFTVIYLDPDDDFLEDLEREVEVTDFPAQGDTTTLEWEESIQNFVITDVQ